MLVLTDSMVGQLMQMGSMVDTVPLIYNTPDAGHEGNDSFSYVLSDGSDTISASVEVITAPDGTYVAGHTPIKHSRQ